MLSASLLCVRRMKIFGVDEVQLVTRIASRLKKKKQEEQVKTSQSTPKTYTSSQVEVPEKNKQEKKKGKGKDSASKSKKRKHVSENVPDISTTVRKRVNGKRVPLNVADVPLDNVSFHSAENAQRWKFVSHRRIARERELSEKALGIQEILNLPSEAGLMKTVRDLGRCYEKLVREFIVNIPSDCEDESSEEFNKVFVRGKCVNLSPAVINEYLGRNSEAVVEGESDLNEVASVITGKLVKKWPKKGLLPSGKLTAKLIFLIGTGAKVDFGQHVFEQIIKHVGSFVVKLPIMFPYLLIELILQQNPGILKDDELQDIVLYAAKGGASASGAKRVTDSSKEDILGELREIFKSLQDTIQASKVRKHNVDQLIRKMIEAYVEDEADHAEEEEEETLHWFDDVDVVVSLLVATSVDVWKFLKIDFLFFHGLFVRSSPSKTRSEELLYEKTNT
ncbi:uncharacterized protein LOC130739555 [Lotus japonicus]|uniref:uncharacterized protein LOC130739555 n=1 Tax=Lotus japonicus TaxID=34305 RepID=UPI0025895126|nr:uncharacterized protein LOC130739555 [Lotus japonicus]